MTTSCPACRSEGITEPAQSQQCAEELKLHMPKRRGPGSFEWHDVKNKVCAPAHVFLALLHSVFDTDKICCCSTQPPLKIQPGRLSFPVSGQNDGLISLRRHHNDPLLGGIMGVEFKKKLSWSAVRQAEMEFLLYADQSIFPFCQVSCPNHSLLIR